MIKKIIIINPPELRNRKQKKADLPGIEESKSFLVYLCENYTTLSETGRESMKEQAFLHFNPKEIGLKKCIDVYSFYLKDKMPDSFLYDFRQKILEGLDKKTLDNITYGHLKTFAPIHNDIVTSAAMKRMGVEEER